MGCGDCRKAISSRLDGEELPGEAEQVDEHLAGCEPCRAFAERAARVTRLTRTRVAEAVPDLAWRRLRAWQDAGVWDRLHRLVLDELSDAAVLD